MRFSLILATIGRVSEVEQFLISLDSQTHRDFELIVVDQNEDERLSSILAAYRESFSIMHLKSKLGLSRARNSGLPHITGDVVAFPDDDCWYPSRFLERMAAVFCDHPTLDGFTGRMMDERGRTGTARFDKEPGLLNRTNAWKRAASITIFLRKGTIEAVGGFDEVLGAGAGTPWEGGEDIDYVLRVVAVGFKIYYKPDIYVFHPSPLECDPSKLADRAYRYGAGIGRVWRKHRYPLWLVAYYLLRPIGGTVLNLLRGYTGKATYHFSAFRGRLRGWLFSY